MRRVTFTAVLLAGVLALASCTDAGTDPVEGAPSVLKLGTPITPASLDPADIQEGQMILFEQALFDSLLTIEPDGTVAPNIATNWSLSDDGLELTLSLRTDVTFSDGTALDAAAVVANLEHMKAGTSTGAQQLATMQSVEAVDEATVLITLSAPNPALLYSLATYAGFLASPAALDDPSLDTAPIGSGPYTLNEESTVVGTRYVFDRNPAYWNAEMFPFDSLEIGIYAEDTARLNALKTGQIDGMWGTPDLIADVEASGLQVNVGDPIDWTGLFLSDRDGVVSPAMGDIKVRQAINYSIDRELIVDSLYGVQGIPTTQVFNPASAAWSDELNEVYPFDLEKARALVEEAGAEGQTIAMATFAGFTMGDILKQQIEATGLIVDLEVLPLAADTFPKLIASPSYTMNMGTNLSPWTDIMNVAAPQSVMNGFQSQTPEFDALMARIQSTSGDDQDAAFRDANEYLVTQAWYAPVVAANGVYFTSAGVDVTMQVAQVVPSLRNFSPAQ